MASAGSTNQFKAALAAMYFEAMTEGPLTVAFGDGGHNEDGTPRAFDPDQEGLLSSLLSKAAASVSMPDDWTIQVMGKLNKDELVGETVSEFGVFLDGDMIALRNSSQKIKDSDEEFPVSITINF